VLNIERKRDQKMAEEKPNHMFSVCTSLEYGYHHAFAQLDQMVEDKIRAIWAERAKPSPGIKIVNWDDKVFPPINPDSTISDMHITIARVVIYEVIY
jgi:hypothetical protein